jgi:hypothetical protein
MEKFLKNQQIPLTQVIDPNTGQAYYSTQNVVYQDKNNTGVTYLKNVIVDQATSASYFSGSVANAVSASYALTASYVVGGIGSPGGPNTSVQFNKNGNFSGSTNFTFNSASNSLTLTGSLNVTGSTLQIGNNTLAGNTTLSGSIIISGSNSNPVQPTIKIYGDMETNGVIKFMPVVKSVDPAISASYIYVSGSTNDLYFSQNGSGYSNTTRLRWIEGNLYTGLLSGGILSSTPGSRTFNLSSGSGIIVTLNATTSSADPFPTIQYLNWGNFTNQPLVYSGSARLTYVSVNSAGAIDQSPNPVGYTDPTQWDNQIEIGVVLHLSGAVSTGVYNAPQVAYGLAQRTDDFVRAFGPIKISGHVLQPSGSTLGLIKTSGNAYNNGANYVVNPNHPSTVSDPATSVSKIYRYYVSGSTPVINTGVANAGFTGIDPSKYNNNGTLASVPGGKYTIQRVFWIPNSPTNAFLVYYGNDTYNSADTAQLAIPIEPFTEAPNTAQNAILLGYVIASGNETNLQNALIIQAGLFRSINGVGSSGTTPAINTFAGLADVSVASRTVGDLSYYNGSLWINSKILSGSYGISGSLNVSQGITGSFSGSITAPGSTTQIVFNNGGVLGATGSFVYSGSRVGIGKPDPNATLDISGSELISGSTTWVLPGYANGYISPGTDGISIGNSNSGVHIRIRNSNRTGLDQSVGIGSPSFGWTTSQNVTIKTGGTTSGYQGILVGNGTNNNIFSVQGDSRVGINLATATSALHVQGTGATSSTTALTVQNANASASLVVLDNTYVGLGKSPSYPIDVALTNGGNANSALFASGIHPDGRAILYGKANTNTEQLIYWWHSGGIGIGTGGSTRGGAVSYVGDTSYYGPAHGMYFMETGTTFGPVNIKYRLGITTSTTNTQFASGVSNNSTNIESNTFTYVAKSHTFYTGTTSGNQSLPSQFIPLYLSDSGSVGIGTTNPTSTLDISGSGRFTNGLTVTGSLIVTGGITGSLLGTASYATQALSASFSLTASYIDGGTF